MQQEAGLNASPVTKNSIFVTDDDSSDSEANLLSVMRRSSRSHKDKRMDTTSSSKQTPTELNDPRRRAGINPSTSWIHAAAPATTSRGELSHVILKRIDLNNPELRKPEPSSDQSGRKDHIQHKPRAKETQEERRQKLLMIRDSRLRKDNGGGSSSSYLACPAGREVEMIDKDFFNEEEFLATPRLYSANRGAQLAGTSQRHRDREAEAKRKQEARDRALRKTERGRAISVSKTYNASRRTLPRNSKRVAEKYVAPVDFGSESEEDNSESADETEWDVEEIRNHAVMDGKLKFEVKWTGYASDENTWEPEEYLENASKLLERYKENHMRRHAAPIAPMMG